MPIYKLIFWKASTPALSLKHKFVLLYFDSSTGVEYFVQSTIIGQLLVITPERADSTTASASVGWRFCL